MSKKKSSFILSVILLVSCICGSAETYGGCKIIYVDANATSCGNGQSWATAYKYLHDALGDASTSPGCDEIRVADGTYKPDQNCVYPYTKGRTATFQLINGVEVKGGYAGLGAPDPNTRNPNLYVTILSGDLLGNDPSRAENSYHVVTGSGTDANAVLDGFTITAGNANGSNPDYSGGGMYNYVGSPSITNCIFSGNSAQYDGGGMYNYNSSSPTITDCNFTGNSAGSGGGIYNYGYASPSVNGCIFIGNSAGDGGGMYNYSYTNPIITNCTFTENSAQGDGGGIYGYGTVKNCIFSGNSAQHYGGGIYGYSSTIITNCTLTGNSVGLAGCGCFEKYGGGGIYGDGTVVTNCILWGNNGGQIGGSPTVYNSDVQGGWPGWDCIDKNPMLDTTDGYHLMLCSPCIDTGTNSEPGVILPPTDIDGQPRIMDGDHDGNDVIVDMGVDEYLNVEESAHCPKPADGATAVLDVSEGEVSVDLAWWPGLYAAKVNGHKVYFGTCPDPGYIKTVTDPCTSVKGLNLSTPYCWRIDEVNASGPSPGFWQGDVWSFTTADYFVVEDFERYANTTALKTVWKKNPAAGTVVDINAVSDMLCKQIHSGKQAMALKYNNNLSRSEAYADTSGVNSLGFGFNWRIQGVNALRLWFHGIADLRGSHSGAEPNLILTGDGCGIYNVKKDVFYYFYREKTGQLTGLVTARVDSIECMECGECGECESECCCMAGVMMRDTLNDNSIYGATVITPDNQVIFMYRGSAGATSQNCGSVCGITLPHWVRIACVPGMPANTIAAHADDVGGKPGTWTQIGSSIPGGLGPSPLYLGLCVTSNCHCEMCTAKFKQVDINSPVTTRILDPNAQKDIGNYVYNDPEAMYVVLQDHDSNGIVYYDHGNKDPNVTQICDWNEWCIDLDDFIAQGVDMCDVRRIYIGIGDKTNPSSGSGTMYFDDIRLYPSCCPQEPCPITYPASNCGGSYQVCWKAVSGATYYELERSSDGGNNWTPIYSSPNTCYNESGLGCGSYLYHVRACNTICGCSGWCTGNHNCVVAITSPEMPCPITYPDSNCGGNYPVCWTAVNCATHYVLDVNVYDGSIWSGWKERYKGPNTCYHENVDPNSYRYRVKAWNPCGDSNYCIGDHNCVVLCKLPAPDYISVPPNDSDGIYDVKWPSVTSNCGECGEISYEVESNTPTSPYGWLQVYDDDVNCYTEKVGGGTWYYRVRTTPKDKDYNDCCPSDWTYGQNGCDVTECMTACKPNCNSCFNEWSSVRYPPCWCNPRQCHGDTDDYKEYIKNKGYYHCHYKDLSLLLTAWNVREPPDGPGLKWRAPEWYDLWYDPNICADFDHAKENIKGKGYYRVHYKDMAILLANWNVREPPQGPGIDPNCLNCP